MFCVITYWKREGWKEENQVRGSGTDPGKKQWWLGMEPRGWKWRE